MKSRISFLVGAIILVCLGATIAAWHASDASAQPEGARPQLTPDQRAALERIRHRIVEAGVIESASEVELRNHSPGETKIISLAPEGALVNKGDLVVVLDASEQRTALQQQRLQVQIAEAKLLESQQFLASAEEQADAEMPLAELRVRVAQLDKDRYLGEHGEFRVELANIEHEIAEVRDELNAADDSDGRVASNRTQDRLELLLEEKRLLEQRVLPHETASRELAVEEARMNLQKQKRTAATVIRKKKAELQVRQQALQAAKESLAEIQDAIEQSRITAPKAGLVLYATPETSARRGSSTTFRPGGMVREEQRLVKIVDPKQLRARVGVHESQIARVEVGQQVVLTLDGLPTQAFTGRVKEIGRTPQPTSWFNADSVEYPVLVEIPEAPDATKIGMSVAAEFLPVARDH